MKCLNGHDVYRYDYICLRCGSHVETDIRRNVRYKIENTQVAHVLDVCHTCGVAQPINWVECSECGTRRQPL